MNQVTNLTSTCMNRFSSHHFSLTFVQSAAMMLSAATVNDNSTRNFMIGQVHQYCASNQNNMPFGAYYNPSSGVVNGPNFAGNNANGAHS